MNITSILTWPIKLIQNYRFEKNLNSFVDLSKNTYELFSRVDDALKDGKILRVNHDSQSPEVYAVKPRNRLARWIAGSLNQELFKLLDNVNYVAQTRLASLEGTMGWRSEESLERDIRIIERSCQQWNTLLEQLETLGATFERNKDRSSHQELSLRIQDLRENLDTCTKIQRQLQDQLGIQPELEVQPMEKVDPLQNMLEQEQVIQQAEIEILEAENLPDPVAVLADKAIPVPVLVEPQKAALQDQEQNNDHGKKGDFGPPPPPPPPPAGPPPVQNPLINNKLGKSKIPKKPAPKPHFSPEKALEQAQNLKHVEDWEKERPVIQERADNRGASPSLLIAGKQALKKPSPKVEAQVVQKPSNPHLAMMDDAAKKIMARRHYFEMPIHSDDESDDEPWD